jgi:hypothetical protein
VKGAWHFQKRNPILSMVIRFPPNPHQCPVNNNYKQTIFPSLFCRFFSLLSQTRIVPDLTELLDGCLIRNKNFYPFANTWVHPRHYFLLRSCCFSIKCYVLYCWFHAVCCDQCCLCLPFLVALSVFSNVDLLISCCPWQRRTRVRNKDIRLVFFHIIPSNRK